ncbi:DUF971 domain-containing protein [Planctomicrobium sp. SH668]|uniref:DUF971 domain-containing protein n=1 Tax=Planctomicrobium sp. SH668 TaxID=3448126 RepID=UPI003F5AE602
MAHPPAKIRALRDAGYFEIQWSNGPLLRYPFKFVRCECPCASCVNEFTGEKMLNPDTIPESVVPDGVSFSGNYALKIQWNDGHNTGLYTWEHLEKLADDSAVKRGEN